MRFFKARESEIRFCDRCSSLCDPRCHAEQAREWSIERAIAMRVGF